MITIFPSIHAKHSPEYEFFRGKRVPCFESPARAEFVLKEIQARGHEVIEPNQDSFAALSQVHSKRYLSFLQTAWSQWLALDSNNATVQPFPSVWPVRSLRSDIEPANFTARLGLYSMDNGTPLVEGTWVAAKAAADAAASAAALISAGRRAVFCASRPPGHHAGSDFMGGYCFLNNAAVAAQSLRANGAARVAILDVDYHHGNGTQSIFYERFDVLFVSIHGSPLTEYPFYLGHADEIGSGAGHGFNVNLPLAAGASADTWFDALNSACAKITEYRADALVVSLGLDTFIDDPISTFALTSHDFSRLGTKISSLGLPTVFVLEGGYAAAQLGVNAANVMDAF